jgi:peptidyl-prolyl cis-trans isomerase B (cyclophilin B)
MKQFRGIWMAVLLLVSLVGCLTACNEYQASTNKPPAKQHKEASVSNKRIQMVTNYGTIVIELDGEKAPVTVENFLNYTKKGFYEGTLFHRVIPNFMIQGGGFTADFTQKETQAPIKNEADNGLKNARGTIAMARTNDPHSATAQFFINVVDNGFLNYQSPTEMGWGYTVFGHVVEGMDVVDKIAAVETTSKMGHQDVPKSPVIIEKVTVLEQKAA